MLCSKKNVKKLTKKNKLKTSLCSIVRKMTKNYQEKKMVLLVEPLFKTGVKIATKYGLQKKENLVRFSSS